MNFYLTKFLTDESNEIELINSTSLQTTKTDLNNLHSNFEEYSALLFLLPCSKYTTYNYEYDDEVSRNINEINFIDEIDTLVVKDISSQRVIFTNNQALLIDKDYLNMINSALSNIKANIYLIPEHLVLADKFTNMNVNLKDEFLIIKNGIPARVSQDMLNANSSIFSSENTNSISIDDLFTKNFIDEVNKNIKSYPNLFSFNISLDSLKMHLDISKKFIYAVSLSLALIFGLPYFYAFQINNKYTEYKEGMYQVFRALDYNVTNISNPKRQADLIADNFDLNTKKSFQIPNLEFIEKFGIEYIEYINILPLDATANIYITDFPSTQLSALLALSSRFDVNIIERNLNTQEGLSSGNILVSLSDE